MRDELYSCGFLAGLSFPFNCKYSVIDNNIGDLPITLGIGKRPVLSFQIEGFETSITRF